MGVIRDYIESRLIYLQENNKNIHQDTQPWAMEDVTQVLISMVKNNPLAKETVLSISTAIDIAKTGALSRTVKDKLLSLSFPLRDAQIRGQKILEVCSLFRALVEAHQKEVMEVLAKTEKLSVSEKEAFLNNSNKSYLSNLLASQGFTTENPNIPLALVYFLNEMYLIYDQDPANLSQSYDDNLCASLVNTLYIADEGLSLDSNAAIFLSMVGEEKFKEYLNRVLTEEQFQAMLSDMDIVDLIADPNFNRKETIDSLIEKLVEKTKKNLNPSKTNLITEKNDLSLKAGLLQALAEEHRKAKAPEQPKNNTEGIINILFNAMRTRSIKKIINSTSTKDRQYSPQAVLNSNAKSATLFERSNTNRQQAQEETQKRKPLHSGKRRT